MKKSVMRMFSMLLALVMLLGMSATAEIERITFDLNGSDGLKLDGILSVGYDEDGCEQYSFVNSVIGKYILQSDGNDLAFGGDQMGYYVVSADDLTEAISIVSAKLAEQGAGGESMDIINYINSPAFEQDTEMVAAILANEVNRFASIAQSMDFVVIHENGDLAFDVDIEGVFALINAYLESLSEDAEVLNAFANLEFFRVMEVPMAENAEQLPAILKDAAAQVVATYAEVKDMMDGGMEIYVSAETGVMNGRYYASTMENGDVVYSVNETFTVSDDGMVMTIENKENGVETKVLYAFNGEELSYQIDANADDQNLHALMKLDENGLVAEATADTDALSGEGKIVVDVNGVNGKWDFTGKDLVLNGSINYDSAFGNVVMKIDHKIGSDSVKESVEFVDGELYAESTTIEDGRIVSTWTVSGSDPYRIKGNWIDGYSNCSLDATIRSNGNGVEVEGEMQAGYEQYTFRYADATATTPKEFLLVFEDSYTKTTYKTSSTVTDEANVVTLFVSEESDSSVMALNATVETDALTGAVSGEFVYEENGVAYPGSFACNADGLEFRFSDNNMSYRIYAEGAQNGSDIALKAGISAEEFANPGAIIDGLLFILNADTMTGVFDALFTMPMVGNLISAAFDGQTFTLEVTTEGETIAMVGRKVATDDSEYIEFTGFIAGVPFEARMGLKMEDANTLCLFAEAFLDGAKTHEIKARLITTDEEIYVEVSGDSVMVDGEKIVIKVGAYLESEETIRFYTEILGEVPEHKVGAYLPLTVIENANGSSVSASLTTVQGDYVNEVGNVFLAYETLDETLEHIDGERLTTEMLVEMIYELLGVY